MAADAEGRARVRAEHLDLAGRVGLDPDRRLRLADVAQQRSEQQSRHARHAIGSALGRPRYPGRRAGGGQHDEPARRRADRRPRDRGVRGGAGACRRGAARPRRRGGDHRRRQGAAREVAVHGGGAAARAAALRRRGDRADEGADRCPLRPALQPRQPHGGRGPHRALDPLRGADRRRDPRRRPSRLRAQRSPRRRRDHARRGRGRSPRSRFPPSRRTPPSAGRAGCSGSPAGGLATRSGSASPTASSARPSGSAPTSAAAARTAASTPAGP